ncbi:DUF5615 family PIN-like protein [Longimicrobium terrae]|uniref:Putative nuclease of putative toxin-antitoxin system n=1 Tax=Longimicrobium terrae TaxID=1639882 RepID=A0A841GXX7_9BACT|nr:DUF5615 family PIN-like protein [Longimicrobium terrae]MBB4636209.1 putative nuclease of putative toxin-antitoxin system [Longimicrobium terrae]MBB6070604.1 putative nuclease of putative toxin-antitoxin system [Longimicrobium terrae]NNC29589.1 DUF5615 family PIN-like protein [Longimicrobium terrae]
MRFLADENVSALSVTLLRAANLDIESVAELAPGSADTDVLALARATGRVLITQDRDFGELIYYRGAPAPRAVIYIRRGPADLTAVGHAVAALVNSTELEITGYFTVVYEDRIRQRRLPS